MPTSRYPRPGHRIAPVALREILGAKTQLAALRDKGIEELSDLDETSWMRFSPQLCEELAGAIVAETKKGMHWPAISRNLMPKTPEGVDLDELELEARTHNCLRKAIRIGILRNLNDLGSKTIGEVIYFPGFGARCLVDLLTSLEALISPPPSKQDSTTECESGSASEEGPASTEHQRP